MTLNLKTISPKMISRKRSGAIRRNFARKTSPALTTLLAVKHTKTTFLWKEHLLSKKSRISRLRWCQPVRKSSNLKSCKLSLKGWCTKRRFWGSPSCRRSLKLKRMLSTSLRSKNTYCVDSIPFLTFTQSSTTFALDAVAKSLRDLEIPATAGGGFKE